MGLIVAATGFGILLLGWGVYPAVLWLLGRGRRPPQTARAAAPTVTVVLATWDDAEVVGRRVENLVAADFPADRLEVVVAVDPRADGSLEGYRSRVGSQARVVRGDAPGGKAATLNAGVRAATGEVVVFADSSQTFERDAISHLVGFLCDTRFGAVSGAYEVAAGRVLDTFWRFEVFLRRRESLLHSVVGVTGAIYAIRRSLWVPLPAGLICDDLWLPLRVVLGGHRVGFCEQALARDARRFTRGQEFRRRVRTLTGILQVIAWRPSLLVPWRNPIWAQLVCHKLIRVATPFLLLASLAGAAPLLWGHLAGLDGVAVGVGAGVVLLGALARPRLARGVLVNAGWATLLLAAPLTAAFNALRGRWDVWQKT